jgi:hypothetical protein
MGSITLTRGGFSVKPCPRIAGGVHYGPEILGPMSGPIPGSCNLTPWKQCVVLVQIIHVNRKLEVRIGWTLELVKANIGADSRMRNNLQPTSPPPKNDDKN